MACMQICWISWQAHIYILTTSHMGTAKSADSIPKELSGPFSDALDESDHAWIKAGITWQALCLGKAMCEKSCTPIASMTMPAMPLLQRPAPRPPRLRQSPPKYINRHRLNRQDKEQRIGRLGTELLHPALHTRWGSRRLEARWAAKAAAQGQLAQPDQPEQPGPSRVRGAPNPFTDAPCMHSSRPRPPPLRGRAPLQPAALPALTPEPVAEQPAALKQRQHLAAALRTDTADIMDLAEAQPGCEEWAHTWTAVHSSALDRAGRVTAWRLLHGRLFVGASLRHIGRGSSSLCNSR